MKVLSLKSLSTSFNVLSAPTKKIIAAYFIEKMIENDAQVDETNLDAFLALIRCLFEGNLGQNENFMNYNVIKEKVTSPSG